MAEREQRVVTVEVEYVCDDCSKGTMRFTGAVWGSPECYSHKCSNCGVIDSLDKVYPRIEYRPVDKQQPAQSPQLQVGNIDEI